MTFAREQWHSRENRLVLRLVFGLALGLSLGGWSLSNWSCDWVFHLGRDPSVGLVSRRGRDEVAVGDPDEQEDGEAELQHGGDADQRLDGHPPRQDTHDHRENEISDAERDHIVADILHSQRARHVRLCQFYTHQLHAMTQHQPTRLYFFNRERKRAENYHK